MGNRFIVLSFLTGLFQIICGIALVIGLFAIFGDQNASGGPNDPFAQVPAVFRVAAGAALALYGLTGLVFSGGINVLISIDENTHSLAKYLPAAMVTFQKAIVAVGPIGSPASSQVAVETPSKQPAPPPTHTKDQTPDVECANCGATNDPDGRFCEICGNALTTS
jgi:hypothetical protein